MSRCLCSFVSCGKTIDLLLSLGQPSRSVRVKILRQYPGSFPHFGTMTQSYECSANRRWRSLIVRARRALDDLARPAPGTPSYATTSREPNPTDDDERIAHESVPNSPRIFISYAKEDVRYADELRRLLKLADFDPWMDSAGLLGGEAWETRLREVIRTSDFVIALLSEH